MAELSVSRNGISYGICPEMFNFLDTYHRQMAQGIKRSNHGDCVDACAIDAETDLLATDVLSTRGGEDPN